MLDELLTHLAALVACDTRNPPRAIGTGGMFDYLASQLTGFDLELIDHGAGAVSLFARRGQPKVLFNVHLDTVPTADGWSQSPFELTIRDGRAYGLGACDIKGGAAAMVTAARATNGPCAILFSTDEEANDPRCIAAFLKKQLPFELVMVAEPTKCEAVLAHRGISSARVLFKGTSAHASTATPDSALHAAVRWGTSALALAEREQHQRFGGLTGMRFNLGRIEGGIKANVVAPSAEVRFGFRALPSMSVPDLHRELAALVPPQSLASYDETFRGPSLPAGSIADAEERRLAARDLVDAFGLPVGQAVDFWTEASLFSEAGYLAVVYGPGDIAQAHSVDEWVSLAQLEKATRAYLGVMNHEQ